MRNIINLIVVIASLSLVVSCDYFKKQGNNVESTNRPAKVNRIDNSVNVDQLPQAAKDYINKFLPGKDIVRVKVDEDEFEVWLSTGEQLEFDLNGKIKEIEFAAGLPSSVIDERVAQDVKLIDAKAYIVEIDQKPNGDFDVKLNNGKKISYDADYKRIDF